MFAYVKQRALRSKQLRDGTLKLADRESMRWTEQANCKDASPEIFFPKKQDPTLLQLAVKICRDCQVQTDCLAFAIENNIDQGVWGGMDEIKRRRLRKRAR